MLAGSAGILRQPVAFEPQRHFSGLQVLTLVLAIMVQIGLCTYVLLA